MTYEVITYYRRKHRPKFKTRLEAENFIKARGLTCTTQHYTELWELNGFDGEQLAVYENSSVELVPKQS